MSSGGLNFDLILLKNMKFWTYLVFVLYPSIVRVTLSSILHLHFTIHVPKKNQRVASMMAYYVQLQSLSNPTLKINPLSPVNMRFEEK